MEHEDTQYVSCCLHYFVDKLQLVTIFHKH